jgi:hypothetical protein
MILLLSLHIGTRAATVAIAEDMYIYICMYYIISIKTMMIMIMISDDAFFQKTQRRRGSQREREKVRAFSSLLEKGRYSYYEIRGRGFL